MTSTLGNCISSKSTRILKKEKVFFTHVLVTPEKKTSKIVPRNVEKQWPFFGSPIFLDQKVQFLLVIIQ